jgi:hypothetical protein
MAWIEKTKMIECKSNVFVCDQCGEELSETLQHRYYMMAIPNNMNASTNVGFCDFKCLSEWVMKGMALEEEMNANAEGEASQAQYEDEQRGKEEAYCRQMEEESHYEEPPPDDFHDG